MRISKTLIRLVECPGCSESLLGAHSLCWFCHVAAQIDIDLDGERIAEISTLIKEKFSIIFGELGLISNQTYSSQQILIAGH